MMNESAYEVQNVTEDRYNDYVMLKNGMHRRFMDLQKGDTFRFVNETVWFECTDMSYINQDGVPTVMVGKVIYPD